MPGRSRRRTGCRKRSSRASARWCRMLPSSPTSSRSPTRPRTRIRAWIGSASMPGQDDLDVVAAHVDERRGQHLTPADLELPDLGVGHRDEVARLRHEVRDPRPRHEIDEALDAVARGQDRDFGLFFHGHRPLARSRSTYFWILPVAVVGTGPKTTLFGILKRARFWRHQSM